jgi:Allophanate hydrolase subunit 1.
MQIQYQIFPFGDDAVVLYFGQDISKETNFLVNAVARELHEGTFPGFIESNVSFTTITIHYDRRRLGGDDLDTVRGIVDEIIQRIHWTPFTNDEKLAIPVCYHPRLAPDLLSVARLNGMTVEELIQAHSDGHYFVSFVNFGGGIPFLGGVNKKLSAPKKHEPQLNYSPCSVGISGSKTGIFLVNASLAWNIIGRAPSAVLSRYQKWLKPGMDIQFVPITLEEYWHLEQLGNQKKKSS